MKRCCPVPSCCDMRGFLSLLILWSLRKKSMSGEELAREIGARKGARLNPGTIYPALKRLAKEKMITYKAEGRVKRYSLTRAGRAELNSAGKMCHRIFHDLVEAFK